MATSMEMAFCSRVVQFWVDIDIWLFEASILSLGTAQMSSGGEHIILFQ
jgi:hypothetical protein